MLVQYWNSIMRAHSGGLACTRFPRHIRDYCLLITVNQANYHMGPHTRYRCFFSPLVFLRLLRTATLLGRLSLSPRSTLVRLEFLVNCIFQVPAKSTIALRVLELPILNHLADMTVNKYCYSLPLVLFHSIISRRVAAVPVLF